MLNSWEEELWIRDRCRRLLQEGMRVRDYRQLQAEGKRRTRPYSPTLAWLGSRLVVVGQGLQERYGAVVAESDPAPMRMHG